MRTWNPYAWKQPERMLPQLREGDQVQNPVIIANRFTPPRREPEARALAQRIDDALAARGLRIDHPHLVYGWIVKIDS